MIDHAGSEQQDQLLVSIIILNHNGLARLQSCIDAVLQQDFRRVEIIFVDNGSTDGSLEWAAEKLKEYSHPHRVEILPSNMGINRGKNLGASLARGRYLWLLDNDIAPEPSCLRVLVNYLEKHSDVALCGPVLTDFSDPHDIIGGGFRLKTCYRPSRPINNFDLATEYGVPVSYVSGGVMLVRTSIWRELGGFAEGARLYLDDSDFGVRCWLAGYKVVLLPNSRSRHLGGPPLTLEQQRHRFYLYITGVTRFIIRNFPLSTMSAHLITFEAFLLFKTVKYVLRYRHPSFVLDYFNAQYHCIKYAGEIFAERDIVQQTRRVPGNIFLRLEDGI